MMSYATARTIATSEIPVIDIAALRDGSDPSAVAAELRRAAVEVGFIYVKNHGIDEAVFERARTAAFEFFRRPAAEKATIAVNRHHRGYIRVGDAKMTEDAKADLKESFLWGLEMDEETDASVKGNRFLAPNRWPDFMPELRNAVYPFYAGAQSCAIDLLRGFALGSGLPEDSFVKAVDLPISRASITYYPPQEAEMGENQFGVAPHTDFGVLTVLRQDEVGGLQVQNLEGEWLTAHPIPGTLVINVGDLLERWTNGVFRSTPHRVVNASGRERLSLVLGFDPNFETLVDPAVICAEGDTPKFEPITCGDYLSWRMDRSFAYKD